MTSSFGQVIGTERDEIPDISSTNYNRTDPNLDEANKRAIEQNIEDTQQFYSTMKELARIQAETPMKNLEQLAVFSSSLANYKLVSEEFEEARKLKQEGRDAYEAGLEDIFNKEQNDFNYANAVFTNELFNEGTFESRELLAAELNIPTEYDSIEDFWQEVNPSMIDAGFTTLQDNGWWSMPTVSEALELYGDVQERMIATYLHLATESGIDIVQNAAVKLYYDTSKKFETYASGCYVYGKVALQGSEDGNAIIEMFADEGDDAADKYQLASITNGNWELQNYSSGSSWETNMKQIQMVPYKEIILGIIGEIVRIFI